MKNDYKIDGNTLIVYNRKDGKEMLFDAEDFNLVKQYTWYIAGGRYVQTYIKDVNTKKYKLTLSHRLIMNPPDDMQIDHINRIKVDNRKKNLRIATRQVNNQNRTAKGYSWSPREKKWKASIRVNRQYIYLGYYNTESEARQAYLEAKKIYHPTAPV